MSEVRSHTVMFRGARVSKRSAWPMLTVDLAATIHRPAKPEAFALASENRHKPWARRWLRQNRYLVDYRTDDQRSQP